MPYDNITFGLALIGYALLAADAARRFVGRRSSILTMFTAGVVLAHVVCVWAFRFEWSFSRMWQKSIFGFLVIVASVLAHGRLRDRLVMAAFAIVCVGAIPAPFRYPEIEMLRLPVPAVFVVAVVWVLLQRRSRR